MNKRSKDEIKENIKKFILKKKYYSKAKKLNISFDFLEVIIERYNGPYFKDIIELIDKSTDLTSFKKNIIKYLKNNKNVCFKTLLLGNFIGSYNWLGFEYNALPDTFLLENFNEKNFSLIVPNLKKNFYKYIISNNKFKNAFAPKESELNNLSKDLEQVQVNKILDEILSGTINVYNYDHFQIIVATNYLFNIIGTYPLEDIVNNFDFILEDLNNSHAKELDERRKEYLVQKKLTKKQKENLKNLPTLISKLQMINSIEAEELLVKINKIKNNLLDNLNLLNDIYLEYEILYRKDILAHLYKPTKNEIIIDNFQNLHSQLIHLFIRNPEVLREKNENKIKQEIINSRTIKNDDLNLTDKEEQEFRKRCYALEAELNQTQVNYSINNTNVYSDKDGFYNYISDTSNQIAASIYSENYFLRLGNAGMIGIGFNGNDIVPEAIVLSSKNYLTTNKGLNNLEYDETKEFSIMSSTYEELKENDGRSEIVLFRRNMDYDSKASYIFCTIDSSSENSLNIINKCRELAKNNNLKLVIYDLYKIRKSYQKLYEEKLKIEEAIENSNPNVLYDSPGKK